MMYGIAVLAVPNGYTHTISAALMQLPVLNAATKRSHPHDRRYSRLPLLHPQDGAGCTMTAASAISGRKKPMQYLLPAAAQTAPLAFHLLPTPHQVLQIAGAAVIPVEAAQAAAGK